MIEPIPRIDWSTADKATEELRAKLQPTPPSQAGFGLGQNGDVLDSLGSAGGDGGASGGTTFTLDVIESGVFVRYSGIPAASRATF